MHIYFDIYHYHNYWTLFAMHDYPFIETGGILAFLVIFRWFWAFRKYMIYLSLLKTLMRCIFSSVFSQITSCVRFSLILSYTFNFFLQNGYYPHKRCILFRQDFLSNYFYHNLNCCQDLNNQPVEM